MKDKEFRMSAKTLILPLFLILLCCVFGCRNKHHTEKNETAHDLPQIKDRGELILVYALWKAKNGGYGFEVMSKEDIDNHARRFSQSFSSGFSPWKTNYEEMAKKTVIKKCLKYAPVKSDFVMQVSNDETVKSELSVDMSEIANEQEPVIDAEYNEVVAEQETAAAKA